MKLRKEFEMLQFFTKSALVGLALALSAAAFAQTGPSVVTPNAAGEAIRNPASEMSNQATEEAKEKSGAKDAEKKADEAKKEAEDAKNKAGTMTK
jgi:hypothetical protein